MKLSDLIESIDVLTVSGALTGSVSDICHDSRRCGKNSLFVAIPGLKFDGHDYVSAAIKQGARSVVSERDIPREPGVTYITVKDSRRALGRLAKKFYRNPTAELCLIGVTGTNGKTTVTYLLESILKAAGIAVGVVGTINYRYGEAVYDSAITTPESIELQRIFRDMVDAGMTHVVTEVSSHALDLGRVDDCEHDMGIFTNLSQDHLDYHHTIESYYLAKKRFFREILKDGEKMIINADDPWGRRMIDEVGNSVITYGIDSPCDISVDSFDLSLGGIAAAIRTGKGKFTVASSMIGKFNLYNILAAIAAAVLLDIPDSCIQEGIGSCRNIPGRFEKVGSEDDPAVFVDYAHTDDALKNVLANLAEFKQKRIITVFGCGGDRDRGKRPLMAKAVADLSDLTIVTSDNPRTEDPLAIIGEIAAGIQPGAAKEYLPHDVSGEMNEKGYVIIPDRSEAIHRAISIAGPLDIVLIAGKGHEKYQLIGNRKIPFDDVIVAREALAQRSRRTG